MLESKDGDHLSTTWKGLDPFFSGAWAKEEIQEAPHVQWGEGLQPEPASTMLGAGDRPPDWRAHRSPCRVPGPCHQDSGKKEEGNEGEVGESESQLSGLHNWALHKYEAVGMKKG